MAALRASLGKGKGKATGGAAGAAAPVRKRPKRAVGRGESTARKHARK
jgi:hypothetical protein